MIIRVNVSEEAAGILRTGPKEVKPEVKKAINELATKTRNRIYQNERKTYVLKTSDYKKSDLKIKRASNSRLEATITSAGESLSLKKHYRTRVNQKRTAAKAMVLRKTGTPKPIEKNKNKAFLATVTAKNKKGETKKHTGIFVRAGKTRLKIHEKFGPGVGKVTEKVFKPMQEETGNDLQEWVNALTLGGGK